MSDEYFFGITLNESNKEYKWEPDTLKENGDVSLTPQGEHILVLKQALLVKGKEGEVNVVQAECTGFKQQLEIPIAALEAGKTSHIQLDLTFPDTPVVLKLIEGTGPVHIAGIHSVQTDQYAQDEGSEVYSGEEEMEEDIEEEEEEEVEVPEPATKGKGKGKKRANANTGPAPSKKKKTGKESA